MEQHRIPVGGERKPEAVADDGVGIAGDDEDDRRPGHELCQRGQHLELDDDRAKPKPARETAATAEVVVAPEKKLNVGFV